MKIVTGMHRSGTSFLAQAMHEIGIDFGDPALLFPADRWNAKGYFENIDIIDVNNKLVLGRRAALDYWLDMPESGLRRTLSSLAARKWKYLALPSRRTIARRVPQQHDRMQELAATYRNTHVKDPRFCLTLHAWSQVADIDEIDFIFRSPLAVAASIKRREGLPLRFGLELWRYHIDNFLRSVPAGTIVRIHNFDNFLSKPTSEVEFRRFLDKGDLLDPPVDAESSLATREQTLERLMAVLDLRLGHLDDVEPSGLPRRVAETSATLRRLHAESNGALIWPKSIRSQRPMQATP